MKIYIIGICGTFMGGVARLARDTGWQVSGSDANTYPPMSTQLESLGVQLYDGYATANVDLEADIILVGNTISRGNPELEMVLERGLAYTSGAQWLAENILQGRWVLAVAGTHGKTTTSSILAWLLEDNQLSPGFLIGGVPLNFGESARLGETPFFIIEADEYDSAFSDKRSKFVHYRPRTLVLNNLEFDHADIFADIGAIQTQFHHLLKTIPEQGLVIHNTESSGLDKVFDLGCWSETVGFSSTDNANGSANWQVNTLSQDASEFEILHAGQSYPVSWSLIGEFNMLNALAAVAAAHHVGVTVQHAVDSLPGFQSIKRRMEKIYDSTRLKVYDDFAHHPTAIQGTVNALRERVGSAPIIAVLEPRSNTMKQGVHKHLLADAVQSADKTLIFADQNVVWDIYQLESSQITCFATTQKLLEQLLLEIESLTITDSDTVQPTINILFMSNGGFEGIHQRFLDVI